MLFLVRYSCCCLCCCIIGDGEEEDVNGGGGLGHSAKGSDFDVEIRL